MVNYLYNVKYKNPFPYKLILEPLGISMGNFGNINAYGDVAYDDASSLLTLVPVTAMIDDEKSTNCDLDGMGSFGVSPPAVNYDLTIVDTPGFGDTRGVKRDINIMQQIKDWFDKKLDTLDAVCFIIKSSDVRLTTSQKYVFDSILNLFGKDVAKNIFILMTHCDASKPRALEALEELNLKFDENKYFKLNNSAYFKAPTNVTNDSDNKEEFSMNQLYWNIGHKSFDKFFNELNHTPPVSLKLTKVVLKTREELRIHIDTINSIMNEAIDSMDELQRQKEFIKANEHLLKNTNNNSKNRIVLKFPTTTWEWSQKKTNWPFHTTCKNEDCKNKNGNKTCHQDCWGPVNCCIIKKGVCTICGCESKHHENTWYYYIKRPKTVNSDLAHCDWRKLDEFIREKSCVVMSCVQMVTEKINKLREIALNNNVLSGKQLIEQMIEIESCNPNARSKARTRSLQYIKKQMDKMDVIVNDEASIIEDIQQRTHKMKSIIGADLYKNE